ncbi:MAG: hypothetical protein BHV68_02075 [Bacteroidales bacterium 43_8]|nr:MAG: hypothetical protein BHV68_02075 [Bacteroidales bacterium 43_8]
MDIFMDSLSYSFGGLAKKAAIRSRAWSDSEKKGFYSFFICKIFTYIKSKKDKYGHKDSG